MLRQTSRRELTRLYTLFGKVHHGLEAVSAAFRDHVNREGA
jgi:hypothetical protein